MTAYELYPELRPRCPRCGADLVAIFTELSVELTVDEVDALVQASLTVGNCPECYDITGES